MAALDLVRAWLGSKPAPFPLSVGVLIGNSLGYRGEQRQGEGLELEAGVGWGLAGTSPGKLARAHEVFSL